MHDLTQRVREDARIAIAVAVSALLFLAWIGWAIYVTSDRGAGAGLGVVIAWPAMLAALILIGLPIAGIYLLIRRLATPSEAASAEGGKASGDEKKEEDEETKDEKDDDQGEEDDGEDEDGEPDEDEEGKGEESDDEDEKKAKSSGGEKGKKKSSKAKKASKP